jgi:hypothetical protein
MAIVTFGVRSLKSRLKNLEDLLLCFIAQTNQDFEILIITENDAEDELKNMIKLYDTTFQKKIKIILGDLNRSKRIKTLISQSNTEFTVFIDDDDHVHDNYVQVISEIQCEAIVVCRSVSRIYDYPNSLTKTKNEFEVTKSKLVQFFENEWPFGSVVFPTAYLKEIELNNNLDGLEDWDLIQKVLMIQETTIFSDEVPFIYNRRLNIKDEAKRFEAIRNQYFNRQIMLSRLELFAGKEGFSNYNAQVFDLITNLKSKRDLLTSLVKSQHDQLEILFHINQELEKEKLYKFLVIVRQILNYVRRKSHD